MLLKIQRILKSAQSSFMKAKSVYCYSLIAIVWSFSLFVALNVGSWWNTCAQWQIQAQALRPTEKPDSAKVYFHFSFALQPAVPCNFTEADQILVLVPCQKNQEDIRNLIRESWASVLRMHGHKVFFVIASNNGVNETALYDESDQYGDLIVVRLKDTYDNLILKVNAMLQWANETCRGPTWFAKIDIDTFVNPWNLMVAVRDYSHLENKPMLGRCIANAAPIRRAGHKWNVPMALYPPSHYPIYCKGPAYIIPFREVSRLLRLIPKQGFSITMEDVYYTGILADLLDIKRVSRKDFSTLQKSCRCVLSKTSVHMLKAGDNLAPKLKECWRKLTSCQRSLTCGDDRTFDCHKMPHYTSDMDLIQ